MTEDVFTDEYAATSTQRLVPSTQPVRGTRASLVCAAVALLLATLTTPPGDPDWKVTSEGYKWRARTAPHPQGLSSINVGASGAVFKLKGKAKDLDAIPIVGFASIDLTLTIGDDVWTGPVPSCELSGSGNTLKCR